MPLNTPGSVTSSWPTTTTPTTSTSTTPATDSPTTTNVNIAPPASNTAAPATTTTPVAAGPASPGQPSLGGYSVSQIVAPTDSELQGANETVNSLWQEIQKQQAVVAKAQANAIADPTSLNAATSSLDALYTAYSHALDRVQSANANRSKTLNDAIHNGTIDPSQVKIAQSTADKADADAGLAKTQADVLQQGSQGQRDLVAAQAASNAQQGLLAKAQADAVAAKTPDEKAQLQAQATALQAQAASTNAMIGPLVEKTKAETGLTTAQAGLTDANSDLARANINKVNADTAATQATTSQLVPAQAGLAGAQATNQLAGAAGTLADVQKGLQGPVYGLQDQAAAIQKILAVRDQIFGPGGSGDPNEASDLLGQFIDTKIAGTTPYDANVAAANAGLTAFGTQASLANAAQAAAASRASALTGFGGSALGSLLGVMKDAPAGSTALGGAFQDVMNQMQSRLGGQAAFAPPQMPQAPQLPRLLQNLAGGGVSAVQPAGGPAPPPMGMPPAAPAPTSFTINVGGQPAAPQAAAMPTAPSFPGASTAGAFGGLPGVLQQHAPAGLDTVHQLWSNELQGGAVRSPYASGGIGGA